MEQNIPYVGIIVPTGMKEFVEGIARFVSLGYRWRVKWFSGWGGTDVVKDVLASKCDGLIVHEDRPSRATAVARDGIPTVVVFQTYAAPTFAQVGVDNALVGEMAADYLLNRGFENLGVFSNPDTLFSTQRCHAFAQRVKAQGKNCLTWSPFNQEESQLMEGLGHWLTDLPKPVAVFCESDWRQACL